MPSKTGYLSVRLAPEDHELIRATAKKLGMTTTDYVVGQALLVARGGSTLDRITDRLDTLEAAVTGHLSASNTTLADSLEALAATLKADGEADRKATREEIGAALVKLSGWMQKRWPVVDQ